MQGACEDTCDEVLAAERKEAERRLLAFREGSLKRKEELASFSELREKTARDLEGERSKVQSLESGLNETKDQLAQLKILRLEHRLKTIMERTVKIASDPETGILNGLSTEELSWMIVHACQTAGEVQAMFSTEEKETKLSDNNRNNDLTTCVPLRLAGLDAGLIWETTSYKPKYMEEAADKALLAEILDFNLKHTGSPVWTQQTLDKTGSHKAKPQNRRRLTEENPDLDDGDYIDEDDLDDFDEDTHRQRREQSREKGAEKTIKKSEQEERRLKLEQLILEQPFSRNRVSFRQKAEKLVAIIDAAKENSEEEDTNIAEDANQSGEVDPIEPMVDPIVFPFIENKLDSRSRVVQSGTLLLHRS